MWPFIRRPAHPSPDADEAVTQAQRALIDARNLDSKLDRVAREAAEIKRTNHIAAAVRDVLRGA